MCRVDGCAKPLQGPPRSADPPGMSARLELALTGAVAAIACLADAAWQLLGLGGPIGLYLLVPLAVCAAVPAVALVRGARRADAALAASHVDELTELPRGSRLREDVATFLTEAAAGDHRSLLIFDLVGFKKYNDSFGFACGDAMLRRLSGRLAHAVAGHGQIYRLRGGQLALLTAESDVAELRFRAANALSEIGEGFMIRCAHGTVAIPDDAHDVSEALKLADQQVQTGRAALRRQGVDEISIGSPATAAARVISSPYDVARLSVGVGECLGLSGQELDDLECATALRDVGMISVPDGVVSSPGRLSDEDWHFVTLHTLVGERLLRSNFGMDRVASIVRASHERWDGRGYPDGCAGEDIPLASRIAFVCGAFQDMTSQRAHRPALTAAQALEELERCADTQFDPAVVSAFVGAFTDRPDWAGDPVSSTRL